MEESLHNDNSLTSFKVLDELRAIFFHQKIKNECSSAQSAGLNLRISALDSIA